MSSEETRRTDDFDRKRGDPAVSAVDLAIALANPIFNRGDLAQLRRMNPDNPDVPVFWRIMAQQGLLQSPTNEKAWALILHGIAIMTPNGAVKSLSAHDKDMPVGKALFQGGNPNRKRPFYSEDRLRRLLIAREGMLRILLVRIFRMLASRQQPFDWAEMAWFILASPSPAERGDWRRMKIAREYYLAASRADRLDS